jgi:chitodextrinase
MRKLSQPILALAPRLSVRNVIIFALLFLAIGNYVIFHGLAASTTYYVSKAGSNAGGTSWASAWNELDQINWSIIQPGDTIVIDGGSSSCGSNYDFSNHTTARPGLSCGMMYTSQLNVQKSGTSTAPITIKLSTEPGRNGTGVIFGGRTSPLPYCTQAYTPSGSARTAGVVFNTRAAGASNIVLDGSKRSGLMIYGAQTGVNLISDNTSYVTLRNLEIFDNGTFSPYSGGGYHSDSPGIFLDGTHITIDRTLIHDNGQDEIQDNYTGTANTHMPINDLTISSSWLYNHRDHPLWTGFPFNSGAESGAQDCTHVDGLQIYGGGLDQQNLTVKDSVFGPLLAQGVYPSDNNTSFDNVNISNTLFIALTQHPINTDPVGSNTGPTPGHWTIKNITAYLTPGVIAGEVSHGSGIWGSGHSVVNSIFNYGFFAYPPSFTGTNSGNLYYGGDAVPGGTSTNPAFATVPQGGNSPTYAQSVAADFTATCSTCSGKGSSIHKVADLLSSIDTQNAPAPSSDTTAPAVPTNLSATAASSTQVNLSWGASSDNVGTTGYNVYRNGVATPVATVAGTTYADTTVVAGTTYTYQVSAFDAAGNIGSKTASLSVTTPAAPDTLAPTVTVTAPATGATVTGSTVTLSANAVDNTGGSGVDHVTFRVDGAAVGSATVAPYNFTWNSTTVADGQHSITARAVDKSGNTSVDSPVVTVNVANTVPDTTAPTASLTAPTDGATVSASVNLTAQAADNAGGSGLAHVDFLVDGSLLASDTAAPYTAAWNTLAATGGSHTIQVKAYDMAGNVGSSSLVTVTVNNPDISAPSTPTNLTATAASATQVNLSWIASTDNVGVSGYYVQRDGMVIATVNGKTTYTDSSASPNSTYSYSVVAFDTAGNASQTSNTATVTTGSLPDTTAPTAPTNLTATAASATQVNLSWAASTDAGGSGLQYYIVKRDGTQIGTVPAGITTYGDATVASSTTYTYTVVAMDGSGNSSGSSNQAIVTTPAPSPATITINIAPSDDAYIDSSRPKRNYGTSTSLSNSNRPQNTLIKFTVSGVGTKTVTKAKLRLYVSNGSPAGGNFSKLLNNSWSQGSVTWNNQPAHDSTVLTSLKAVTAGSLVDVDLTGLVNGDGVYGVWVSTTSSDNVVYNSKESSSNKPVITVEAQ